MKDTERKICHLVKDVYAEKRLRSSLDYCPAIGVHPRRIVGIGAVLRANTKPSGSF